MLILPNTVYANGTWPTTPSVCAKGAIIMDAKSGTVLYAKNPNKKYYSLYDIKSIIKIHPGATEDNIDEMRAMMRYSTKRRKLFDKIPQGE